MAVKAGVLTNNGLRTDAVHGPEICQPHQTGECVLREAAGQLQFVLSPKLTQHQYLISGVKLVF